MKDSDRVSSSNTHLLFGQEDFLISNWHLSCSFPVYSKVKVKSKFTGTPAASEIMENIGFKRNWNNDQRNWRRICYTQGCGEDTPPLAEGWRVKMPSTAPGCIPLKLFPLSHTKIEANLMKFSRIRLQGIHVTQYPRTHVKRVCT